MDNDELSTDGPKSHRWPDVPRLCFGPGPEWTLNACVGWARSGPGLHSYVEGYRRAALALFEEALSGTVSPDVVVFPLAFLWRHHVELALKDLIATGRALQGDESGFPQGHKLMSLWWEAKPYVLFCGSDDAPELKNVEASIQEFERIDPYADGFRYPLNRDRSAATMPDVPAILNLRTLQDAMEAVSNFLLAVQNELSVRLTYQRDSEAER